MKGVFAPIDDLQSRKLPIDSVGFEVLRSSGQIYVDKASFVFKLAVCNASFFLSRPRRFGKTLLLSTFKSLFEHGLKYFLDLQIDHSFREFWSQEKSYKVLRLDFSLCNAFTDSNDFLVAFENMLSDAMLDIGCVLPSQNGKADHLSSRFSRFLDSLNDTGLVLLIDEYDAPLNHCLHNTQLFENVRAEIFKFYSVIKSKRPKFRFVFMTGISKYKNLGIFSGINNFTDLSLIPDYGTVLGYTKEEVAKYFELFLKNAASVLNLSSDEVLKKMAEHYDGFCFDERASTHVFNPWSVLNFLKYPQRGFRNYWYESGGQSSLLLNYISVNGLKSPDDYAKDVSVLNTDLDSSQELASLKPAVLLYQAGYLTIKRCISPVATELNYPNLEVSDSMARVYVDKFVHSSNWFSLYSEFMEHEPEHIVQFFNRELLAIPYISYPVNNEAVLQAILGCCIRASGLDTKFETSNAFGRSDLEVNAGARYFVIELKFAKKEALEDKLLDEAVAQIKSRHYGEHQNPELQHVHMALVYSQSKRQFVKTAFF